MADKNLPVSVDSLAGGFLQEYGKSLAEYAVRDYNQGTFLKSAMIAIVDNQDLVKLVNTPAGKKQLFGALRYAATIGLSLNPHEGKACLIPYGNKIQYQVMKNGMIDLAMESGKVDFITAEYVRENDKFSLKKTVNGDEYEHIPAIKSRGALLGFYAALKLRNGKTHLKWMTAEEMDEWRKKFSSKTQMPEIGYGLKTIMKALLRNISISDALANAVGADDFYEADFSATPADPEPGASAEDVAEALQSNTHSAKSTGQSGAPVGPETTGAGQGSLL